MKIADSPELDQIKQSCSDLGLRLRRRWAKATQNALCLSRIMRTLKERNPQKNPGSFKPTESWAIQIYFPSWKF